MIAIYTILEIILSILLIVVIIFQSRGSGGGIMFGGGGESYRSKRGLEKILFYATIILAALFALVSVLSLINR
ncbi:MAG: preprotein translocase subunit SecG [Candidatus Levyibacteriota bacterium]